MSIDDELRELAEAYMEARNSTPVEDFLGLSPSQMQHLIYAPFAAPDVVNVSTALPDDMSAPLLDLFMHLASHLKEKPLTLTQAGYLPVAVCTAIASSYETHPEIFWMDDRKTNIREGDFADLHVTHVVGKVAGLLNKRNGKLHLTARARKLLDKEGPGGIYQALFRTFVSKYNWGYMDGYPEYAIIQQSWAFSCFMLQRDGHVEQPAELYAARFLQAFPLVMQEARDSPWRSPEDDVKNCYYVRTIARFMAFLGLVELRQPSPTGLRKSALVSRRPLLMQLMEFHI